VGGLTAAAAAHLGLPAGVPVAQGGADAFVGMLGLGVVSPNQLALITGSSHLLLGLATERFHGEGLFGTYADALLPGTHVVEGGQTSTGSVVNWFKKLLGSPEVCAPGRACPCHPKGRCAAASTSSRGSYHAPLTRWGCILARVLT
jgi:ribulose kinase